MAAAVGAIATIVLLTRNKEPYYLFRIVAIADQGTLGPAVKSPSAIY